MMVLLPISQALIYLFIGHLYIFFCDSFVQIFCLILQLEDSPGGGHGNPLQGSCLKNHQGQRSLVVYSLWGHKELDMTEHLSIHIVRLQEFFM